MLKVDLTRLTQEEIERVVALNCARLGYVNSIAVLRPETKTPRAFAFVKMGSTSEMEAVAKVFGDGRVGEIVVVRLVQEEQFIQSSSLNNAANAG